MDTQARDWLLVDWRVTGFAGHNDKSHYGFYGWHGSKRICSADLRAASRNEPGSFLLGMLLAADSPPELIGCAVHKNPGSWRAESFSWARSDPKNPFHP